MSRSPSNQEPRLPGAVRPGAREEALAAVEEAVTIRRELARAAPHRADPCAHCCPAQHQRRTCPWQKPGYCPHRVNTRAAAGRVKSKAGGRTIGLPPQLLALLQAHRAEQDQERASARQIWHGEGWVFATPDGKPLNPNTDYHKWKRLLKDAGLREARLHDARHTAATVLLVLRQPTPTVMSLMGWSSESMAARYQHVTDAMRSQVASQVGELIWNPQASPGDRAAVTIPRDSLAAVLAIAEKCVASHRGGSRQSAEGLAALAELRAALPDARPEK